MIYVSWETKKEGPRRDLSSNAENPEQTYVQTVKAHSLNT